MSSLIWAKSQVNLGLSVMIGLFISMTPMISIGEIKIHVANNGNDQNSGTIQRPFGTLARAKLEVRKLIREGLKQDVTVLIHAGTYELSETLLFGPEDSGTEQFSIRYMAVPGKIVTLSGGRRITKWHRVEESLWEAKLPPEKTGKWFFRQLVVNDQRAVRARWPNVDGDLHIVTVDKEVQQFTFDKRLIGDHVMDHDAELVVFQNWSVTRGRILQYDSKRLKTATAMGWVGHGSATTASKGKTAFIEHARAFLDKPGEWFLDGKSGVLTYIPLPDLNPESTTVVAPVLHKLLEIRGSNTEPVQNLKFIGLQFAHCDFSIPSIGYNEIQAAHFGSTLRARTFVQPVAIECIHTQGCIFEGCRFAHLNGSGIGFGQGCRDNKLSECTIEDIGGSGVMIGWRGSAELEQRKGLDADWRDETDAPSGNIVANCAIRRCGADSFGAVGIFVAFSRDTRISHNQIYDLPYTGLSVGFRWNASKTSQAKCIVEFNHIYNVMQKLADGGGIYTLGFQPETVFRGNYIHDVKRSQFAHGGAPNNGFFIDQGSKKMTFESNVVHSTSGAPVRFNQSQRAWHSWQSNHFGDEASESSAAKKIIEKAGPIPDSKN